MKTRILIILMMCAIPALAMAQMAPGLVNYQGTLQDSSGADAASGNYEIEFRLWDSATAGSAIWGEAVQVYVATGGLFNVLLGSGNPLGGIQTSNLLQALNDGERYLGMTITEALGTPVGSPTEITPRQQMASAPFAIQAANGVPPGSIMAFAGTLTPSGWKLCDGSTVSRVEYADLFAAVGTAYGAGDGSTTFNVPNLKGKIPVGLDSGDTSFDTRGETGGAKTHALTVAELPVHDHTVNPPNTATTTDGAHVHSVTTADENGWNGYIEESGQFSSEGSQNTSSAGSHNHTMDIAQFNSGPTGSGNGHNNLQPYLVVNYIIKY